MPATPRSAPWYGRTRIGLPLKKGLIAVDPTVIPLQSWLYVPGYGVGMAADTGGGVNWQGTERGSAEAIGPVSVSGRQDCEQVREVAIIRGEEVRQAAVFCRDPATGQLSRV